MLDLKKFYNNIKLVYTKNEIEQLNSIYVKNYSQVSSFEELKEKFSNILHPMIEFEFHKQFDAQKGIQGGVLVELSIFATIAQIFNIYNFIFKNGKYICENNEYIFTLQGNDGHGGITNGHDLIIFDKAQNKSYDCEIKEPFARLNEKDFLYDEQGHLCKSSRATEIEIAPYMNVIHAFNQHTNVFEHIGHNIPLDNNIVADIIDNYFSNIDYLFTYQNDYLVVIPKNKELFIKIYDSNGSEIRGTNGKNLKSIFTPVYAKNTFIKYLINEDEKYYYFDINAFEKSNGRQSASHRYKLKEGFAIKGTDAEINNGILKCEKKKIKQNSPLVSPKMKLISKYDDIKKIILEGGYNIDK